VNVEIGAGEFRGLAHPTSGRATAIELAEGGRVLTLTDFETDNGPDLLVYLVSGDVNANGDGDGSIDLGALKGNIGDQQYAIPDGLDLTDDGPVGPSARTRSARPGTGPPRDGSWAHVERTRRRITDVVTVTVPTGIPLATWRIVVRFPLSTTGRERRPVNSRFSLSGATVNESKPSGSFPLGRASSGVRGSGCGTVRSERPR